MRPSDVFFESLNRFNTAKFSGALLPGELSDLIIQVSNVYSNKAKNSPEISEENMDAFMALIPEVNCFKSKHDNLLVAHETAQESLDMAMLERANRYGRVKVMKS